MLIDIDVYNNPIISELMSQTIIEELNDNMTSSLELCCGNGIISFHLDAEKLQKIVLTDINEQAINIAKLNMKQTIFQKYWNKYNFIVSDMFENIPEEKFDIVFGLLPCWSEEEYSFYTTIFKNKTFNPKEAYVASKTDRYALLKKIFQNVEKYLKNNGKIILYAIDDKTINWCKNQIKGKMSMSIVTKFDENKQSYNFIVLEKRSNENTG